MAPRVRIYYLFILFSVSIDRLYLNYTFSLEPLLFRKVAVHHSEIGHSRLAVEESRRLVSLARARSPLQGA